MTSPILKPCHFPTISAENTDTRAEHGQKIGIPAHESARLNGKSVSRERSPAPNAKLSTPRSASAASFVPLRAPSVITITGLREDAEQVYDITVEGTPEFYANGLLVHNCTWMPTDTFSPGRIDASVYLTLALIGSEPAEVGTPSSPDESAPAPSLPVMPGTPQHTAQQPGSLPGLPVSPGTKPSRGIPNRLPTVPGMPRRR
jgi:hypothetical protein